MTDTIPHPVMEPKLYELKIASQVYDPQYNVDWCDQVDAWITTFVDHYNEDDTLDYMFNSKEKAEELLLQLMEDQENG
jgi:CRISPR/Cas system-associated protein Cas7 (RAMP superfamily)